MKIDYKLDTEIQCKQWVEKKEQNKPIEYNPLWVCVIHTICCEQTEPNFKSVILEYIINLNTMFMLGCM